MTATGRNLEAHDYRSLSAYPTPADLCEACLDVIAPWVDEDARILEAHVGGGAWLHAIAARLPGREVVVSDVDPLAGGYDVADRYGYRAIVPPPSDDPIECGFLRLEIEEDDRPDWIIGNPPYSVPIVQLDAEGRPKVYPPKHPKAGEIKTAPVPVLERHLRKALEVARVGVAWVVPAGFLGSKERTVDEEARRKGRGSVAVHRLGRLAEARTLIPRPSFAFGGTDSSDSILAVWRVDRGFPAETYRGGWLVWRR